MLDDDYLKKLYVAEDKTSSEIASVFKCNKSTIIRRLRAMGVEIKRHKRKYSHFYEQKLTVEQKEIVMGSLLGDGCIDCHHDGLNGCRYLESHSEKQLPYLLWKMDKLGNFVSVKKPYQINNKNNKSFGSGMTYRFNTVLHSEFSKMRNDFYVGGKKQVPVFDLTPLSFAMWYYDDGTLDKRGNRISLFTLDFNDKSISNLISMLKDCLGIEAKSFERKWGKGEKERKGNILSLNKNNVDKAMSMLYNFKIESMEYKLI